MKVLSMNVGLPRKVLFNGRIITTAIFKDPVKAPIKLRKLNFDVDKQADLTVHGQVLDKAVYSYPSEHYDYWRKGFPKIDLVWTIFGGNFITEG
jgi:MOSC domain-containing protein YiiM